MKRLILICAIILIWPVKEITAQQDGIRTLENSIYNALEQNIQVRKNELSNQRSVLYSEEVKARRLMSVNAPAGQNFNWSRSNAGSGLKGSNGSGKTDSNRIY